MAHLGIIEALVWDKDFDERNHQVPFLYAMPASSPIVFGIPPMWVVSVAQANLARSYPPVHHQTHEDNHVIDQREDLHFLTAPFLVQELMRSLPDPLVGLYDAKLASRMLGMLHLGKAHASDAAPQETNVVCILDNRAKHSRMPSYFSQATALAFLVVNLICLFQDRVQT